MRMKVKDKRKMTVYIEPRFYSLLEMIQPEGMSMTAFLEQVVKRGINENYNDIYEEYYLNSEK